MTPTPYNERVLVRYLADGATCMTNRPLVLMSVLIVLGAPGPRADAGEPTIDVGLRIRTQEAIDKALAYLVASQGEDGGWDAFGRSHPAITALVVKCLVQDADYGPRHTAAKRGLDFILRHVQPDGGVYVPGEGMRNYHTSVALMALAATKDPAHAKTIRNAQRFLTKLQWDDGEGHEASSPYYGGQGYGRRKRPDLSNTQLMLEALHQSGLSPDDPVYRKAMVFVSRCQMLDKANDQPFAAGSEDGGFVYTPVSGGESKAGTDIVEPETFKTVRDIIKLENAESQTVTYIHIQAAAQTQRKSSEAIHIISSDERVRKN